MGRYYFHVRDGSEVVSDTEGADYPDLSAAQHEAAEVARELAIDELRGCAPVGIRHIEIVDDTGLVVDTLAVRSVLG